MLNWVIIVFLAFSLFQFNLGNSEEIRIWKGEDLELICPFNRSDGINFTWIINNEELQTRETDINNLDVLYSFKDGILQIQGVGKTHEGNYSCHIVANSTELDSHWFFVRIEEFRCPPFEAIENGFIHYSNSTNDEDSVDQTASTEESFEESLEERTIAEFGCQEGFSLNGSKQSICKLEDGGWSSSRPSCINKRIEKIEPESSSGSETQTNSSALMEKLANFASALKDMNLQFDILTKSVVFSKEFNFTTLEQTPAIIQPDTNAERLYQTLKNLQIKFQMSTQALIHQHNDFQKQVETDFTLLRENYQASVAKLESRLNYHVRNMDTFYKTTQKQLEMQIQILAKQQEEQQQWAEDELKVIKSSQTVLLNRLENNLLSQIKGLEVNQKTAVSKTDGKIASLGTRFEEMITSAEEKFSHLDEALGAVNQLATANAISITSLSELALNITMMTNKLSGNHTVLEMVWNIQNAEEYLKTEKVLFYPFYTGIPGYKLALDLRPGSGPFITVYLRIFAGDFDEELKWPAFYDCELAIISKDKKVRSNIVEKTKSLTFFESRDEYIDSFLTSVADIDPPHVKDSNTPFIRNGQLTIRLRMKEAKKF